MSRSDDSDGGFLGRWARRKQEAHRAAREAAPVPALAEVPSEPAAPAAELPLPSLDSIVPGADVSAFFQAHVPDALRTAALRKLWTTDPEISGFIEMADYQWDFNNPDAIPGWGSRLETPDVRRLVQRVLGSGEEERSTPAQDAPRPEGEEATQIAVAQEEQGSPVLVERYEESKPLVVSGMQAGDEDGAVQKTPSDSVLYARLKKRHGGALPS